MIIYKATNKKTHLSYVGQTLRDLKFRKAEHLRRAQQADRTRPTIFHKAISEYGSGEFEWTILEVCSSLEQLNEREKFYIKLLNTQSPNGYNQTTGGHMDSTMSEEIRNRIAEGVRKKHQDPVYTTKLYPKLKGRTPPNKGIPMSNEQKAKVSSARKAVYADPNYINPNIGTIREGQALENVRKGHKRRKMPKGQAWIDAHKDQYTLEVRARMREAKKGKKPSNTKQVHCNETNQTFNGLTEAALALGVNRQSIYLQIKGKLVKVANKYTFKYIEESK